MPNQAGNLSTTQRTSYSAGGVICRVQEEQLQVALIATYGGKRWGIPKGHVRRGESAEVAAMREVAEETGLQGQVLRHLATIEYWFRAGSARVHKYVDLFLLAYEYGTLTPQVSEVDDARWFPVEEAITLASFRRERDVLMQVQQLWKEQKFV
ncbi:MAG: NUDIX hydrolase [Chloroflexaceae bacterium]|nr:NUDIX hydrolase [Chloroflexaceae bacterium]